MRVSLTIKKMQTKKRENDKQVSLLKFVIIDVLIQSYNNSTNLKTLSSLKNLIKQSIEFFAMM